jgi:hypothetical protein
MGGVLKLSISEVKATCEIYDACQYDFEKVLIIENTIYPFFVEKQKQQVKKTEG